MNGAIQILNVVALAEDLPSQKLRRGQVRTAVEQLSEHVFEVEFSDDEGKTYTLVPVEASKLTVLHYQPAEVT